MVINDSSSSSSSDEEAEFMLLLAENSNLVSQEVAANRKRYRDLVKWGGSRPGRAPNLRRDHAAGHQRLYDDYLAPNAVYPEKVFRRRYRMRKSLFIKIMQDLRSHDHEFRTRFDALGRPGLSTLQKCTAAMRMLAYSQCADSLDECIRAGESTILYYMKRFCKNVIEIYEEEFLRQPTREDVIRLLAESKSRGFPGMLFSMDCMHW